MSKLSGMPAMENKWGQTITIRFGKDSGVDPPDGFDALKVGDKINAEITGKVTGITQADGSSSIDIEMDEVELESAAEEAKEEKKEPPEGKSIGETLAKIENKKKAKA